MPHPGHGKGHSLKGSSNRGSSSDSYMKGPSDDRSGEGSPGKTCEWCGKFIKAHGDYWEVNLKEMSGGKDYPFYEQIICPDHAKAILDLKEKRSKN